MDNIQSYLNLLKKEEIDGFQTFLTKRNKVGTKQSLTLLKNILADHPYEMRSKLSQSAFNTLKSRLLSLLKTYTAEILFRRERLDLELNQQLLLARKLLEQKDYKLGFNTLNALEIESIKFNRVHYLIEIYQLMLTYSYHNASPPQVELVKKVKNLQTTIAERMNLNLAYSQIRQAFHKHDRNVESFSLERLLKDTYERFEVQFKEGYNFKSLYQIAEMSNISGTFSRNYFGLDLYFESLIPSISGTSIDEEDNLIYHIDLLYIMAHIYFRKKQFDRSEFYLIRMDEQLARNNHYYRSLRYAKHQTLLALNYNYTGRAEQAATILDTIIPLTYTSVNAKESDLQAVLARIMIHFQQNELSLAIQKINRLKRNDNWYILQVGLEWLLHKKFMEILLNIELGQTSIADKLINSLWRKREDYFIGSNVAALPFLKLIKTYHQNPLQASEALFKAKVESSFEWKLNEEEDLFLMSFYAWLKSKMIHQPLYKVTIDLVNGKT